MKEYLSDFWNENRNFEERVKEILIEISTNFDGTFG